MATLDEQFSLWKNEIQNHNYETVYVEFQKQVKNNKWSIEHEVILASRCLMLVRMEAHAAIKNKLDDPKRVTDIFLLTKVCCESVAKRWKLVSVDIFSMAYCMCMYLINSDRFTEAIVVGEFALEYADACGVSVPSENEVSLPTRLLYLFMIPAAKLEPSKNASLIQKLWNFIFSTQGMQIKNMSISKILEYFRLFLYRSSKSEHYKNGDLVSLLNLLSNLTSQFDNAENIFLKICSTVICKLCASWDEKDQVFLVECLNIFHQNHKESIAVRFCKHIFQLTSGALENKNITDLVAECNRELKMLVETNSPVLNQAVVFAAIVMVKKRLWATDKCQLNTECVVDLFELLVSLARLLEDVDMNEFSCSNEKLPKKDVISVVSLAYYVLHFAYMINGVDLRKANIYQRVLDAERLLMKCTLETDELSERQVQQVYSVGGGSCANVCRSLMTAGLHSECIEVALIALELYSSLSAEKLSRSILEPYIKRLVLRLCNCYKQQQKYTEVLRTALVWAIATPALTDTFMEEFCSLKVELSSEKVELTCFSELTCLDLLKTKDNSWKHESLKAVNLYQISFMELQQYLKNKVTLAKPVLKLLKFIDNSRTLSTSKRAEYYILGAKILTNAAENVDKATKISSTIDKFISDLQKVYKSDRVHGNQQWRNCVLLGDLHYVKFRIKLLSARQENESEVKLLESLSKPRVIQPGMEPDRKEDFVTASYTYVSQMEITNTLDAAIEYWRTAENNLADEKIGRDSVTLDVSHIKDAALVYRLYCDFRKEVQAWELMYTVATSLQNANAAVDAFSNLMKTPWRVKSEWKISVETELLSKADENRRLQYQLDYLGQCLDTGFSEENLNALMTIPLTKVQENGMLAKFSFLLAKYLYYENRSSPFSMMLRAYHVIMHQINNRRWTSFAECCEWQALWFDIALFMLSREAEKYLVLQAQKYMKEPFALVQKLGLPLRTCQLLNVSSQLDILTCNVEDCYVKLAYVCTILNCKDIADTDVALQLKSEPVPPSITLSPDFRCASTRNFDLQSSPVLSCKHEFKMPEFIHHDSKCTCDACSNYEYSRLFCEVMSLFSVYYGLMTSSYIADDYFKGVLEMYRMVEERMGNRCEPMAVLKITQLKVSTLIHYVSYLAAKRNFQSAERYNAMAAEYLESLNEPSLKQKCEELMWSLTVIREFKEEQKVASAKRKPAVVRLEKIQRVNSSSTCKTPVRKLVTPVMPQQSKNREDDAPSGNVTPCPRKSRRLLEFNEFCTPLPPRKNRTVKKSQMVTPPDIVLQTPSTLEKKMKKLDIGATQKSKTRSSRSQKKSDENGSKLAEARVATSVKRLQRL